MNRRCLLQNSILSALDCEAHLQSSLVHRQAMQLHATLHRHVFMTSRRNNFLINQYYTYLRRPIFMDHVQVTLVLKKR